MNLPGPLQELVDRKLWPLAVLLLAGLIAVPMLLSKDAAPVTVPDVVPSAVATGESPTSTVVEAADASQTDKTRAVLGGRKDPFRPAKVEKIPTPVPTPKPREAAASGGGATAIGGGGGGASAPTAPEPTAVAPVKTPEPAPAPTYELQSLLVKFGDATQTLVPKNPKRLTGLPAGNPAILYLGLLEDSKTAVFVVDEGVTVQGDGVCNPSPEDCQTLKLKEGETEFFTRGATTYELDLIKVITTKTKVKEDAVLARKAIARGGKRALALQGRRAAAYEYDEETGFVSRKPVSAKSAVARSLNVSTSG